MGNPLATFFSLTLMVLIFFIGAIILTYFINTTSAIPNFSNNPLGNAPTLLYLSVFGFFDKSFFFILIFLLIIDVAISYVRPNVYRAFENIIILLGFGFMFLNTRNIFVNGLQAISFNAILPNTYATLSNNYLALLIFFLLIIATALNFRRDENEAVSGENA